MTRKLKLGWGETNTDIFSLCKGVIFGQPFFYRGYSVCWTYYEDEEDHYNSTCMVCQGMTYFTKRMIPRLIMKKLIDSGDLHHSVSWDRIHG